ncbi:MAG: hypothetical protein AAF387_13245 [Pseudomonadota bacterium]
MAAVDELSQLRRLLIGREQESIERLQNRVELPATRAQDVAEVLVESFELNDSNNEALAAAMKSPVQRCISDSVREDPDEFADALFPVIGPAIRKAVRDSIAALSEKINQALELSFSARGIKWRIESLRTGVPVAELILRDTFIYRVDQAFVMQRQSGLLVAHVARDGALEQDSDAVSAMLTALQDFVRDSFSSTEGTDLDTIRLGGEVVWLFHGPEAITAAIINGQPPREMRDVFQEVTENIHRLHGEQIEHFHTQQQADDKLPGAVSELLQPLLDSEGAKRETGGPETPSPNRALYGILVALGLIVVAWLAYSYWQHNRLNKLLAQFDATPGVELISVSSGKPYAIRVFRDPLALPLTEILKQSPLQEEDVEVNFVPYQSLEPDIVLKRIGTLFDIPDTVAMEIVGERLLVTGQARSDFRARLAGFPLAMLGIEEVDVSGLGASHAELIARLRGALNAPASIDIALEGNRAVLSGTAPLDWIRVITATPSPVPEISALDLGAVEADADSLLAFLRAETEAPEFLEMSYSGKILTLAGSHSELWRRQLLSVAEGTGVVEQVNFDEFVPTERAELQALAEYISEQKFYFLRNDELTESSRARQNRLAADLRRVIEIDALLDDVKVGFEIQSYADSAGTPEQHEAARQLRSAAMLRYLKTNQVDESQVEILSGQPEAANAESQQWRRSEMRVSVE